MATDTYRASMASQAMQASLCRIESAARNAADHPTGSLRAIISECESIATHLIALGECETDDEIRDLVGVRNSI
jgi:Ni,Fe-hydrogenase III large subunit